MLQKHPEVNTSDQVIGWQPVYSTQQQQQQSQQMRSQPNFLLGSGIAVTVLCVFVSMGLLWGKAQKTEAEVTAEIQQALIGERERIQTCITNQKIKQRPLFQTTQN